MPETTQLSSAATTPAPCLPPADIAACLVAEFSLRGALVPLVSERDQNLQLTAADGVRYVVKIVNPDEAIAVTEFQIAALRHLQQQGIEWTPRVVKTRGGDDLTNIRMPDGTAYRIRVVTFLTGTMLQAVPMSAAIATSFGKRLAELDEALATFRHAGEKQRLLWDTQRAAQLLPRTHHIADRAVRAQVRMQFEAFADTWHARLEQLPQQVIHNDANPENVLLNEQHGVAGFIDFGDMLLARRIVDVATAASYLRSLDSDPLAFIAPFVSGYQQRSPLVRDEINLLYDLIRTRLCMTITMLHWRRGQGADEDPYTQKQAASEDGASLFLGRLTKLGRREFLRQLR